MHRLAVAALLLSAGAAIAQTPPATPASPPADATAPSPPTATLWLPRKSAELQLLDKVNARHTTLTVGVGQEAHFGTLTIGVRNCVVRPPDQPAEAAAYLTVNDANNEGVAFAGWMVAGQPALSMLQHPVYDLRVTGCKP
jgi:hypothetical protein